MSGGSPVPVTTRLLERSTATDRAARVRFRRALMLMVMTLVVPGSAQLVAGNRKVGRIAMRIWFGLLAAFVLGLLIIAGWHKTAFWFALNTTVLEVLRLGLMLGAIGWAALFLDAWRIGQPLTLELNHRRAVVGVNGLLCFSVAGSLLFGAHLVGVQRQFILSTFAGDTVTGTHDGRFNVLLLGGDSGAGRWGMRTDSMTVASIDASTGKTVLIGLPRNMTDFPFAQGSVMDKAWPHGFNCGYPACELNGISTWVGDHESLFKHSKNPGVDATVSGIEGITGLKINYWTMVNLQGFKDLVNAVGGVRLNVRQPIPVGLPSDSFYHFLQPGTRKLDGFDTLWYARSRESSDDYSRMARQKCVMNAMLHQISPKTVLTNFESIAKASSAMVSTDIPASEVDRFMQLALKARGQKVATLSLVPPMIDTAHPDITLIKRKVAEAIAASAVHGPGDHTGPVKRHHRPSVVTGGSVGSLRTGYAANQASDLGAVC